ncbi:hypothetical protein ACFWQ6_00870 [Streptomyces coelicoflavus]|uniref:hypothetical protein n=1 Tax=Streptomyces coelicoflavus TaxID=285562 RepID=UPI0036648ADA
MATGPQRSRAARYLDALLHRGPGYDLKTAATADELTAEDARALVDDLGLQLYRAQDALAFVRECCTIAERERRVITPADVREWLKGAQCGRQLAAGDAGRSRVADETAATEVEVGLAGGPVRCPLCPTPLTLHTPNGARAHFTTVHPEQRITGRGTGPWPLLEGEKSSREADATPQADDALTLECSKLTCHRRAPLSETRETWTRPAGEYGWLCPDCAADFFQPGHTYRHSAWSFRCDALTTHPDTGERVALGWFWFLEQRCRPFTAGAGHWRDGWRDITQPTVDSEPPAPATTDTPGEGT